VKRGFVQTTEIFAEFARRRLAGLLASKATGVPFLA